MRGRVVNAGRRLPVVSMITDFGLSDTYVGQMKAVILSIAPEARIVDLTHQIPPQDVEEASFQLATAWAAFPPGSVHLAVVDPGVGTPRRPVAFAFGEQRFVMPDNGLPTLLLGDRLPDQVVVLDRPAYHRPHVSKTFHGRDLFAPVAARLAAGAALDEVGSPTGVESLVRLDLPPTVATHSVVRGPVVSIDHFGNCRTLIRPEDLPWPLTQVLVRCGSAVVRGIVATYGSVPEGRTLALFGSHGGLEIAVRQGSAAHAWGITRGMMVEVSTAA